VHLIQHTLESIYSTGEVKDAAGEYYVNNRTGFILYTLF